MAIETLERPDVETIPYDNTEADDTTRTHIVNPPHNLHIWTPGMDMREMVRIARVMEIVLTALCGYQFIPKKDPEAYPVCEECMKMAGELMRSNDE